MKTVYVFGNEYLKEDALARRVADRLDNCKIIHCRAPDDLLEAADEELVILDVVANCTEPVLLKDIAQLKTQHRISMHDFDVGFFLQLLGELGMGKKIKIIGVPPEGDVEAITQKVKTWI